jgi:hypothetical protein
MWKRGEGKASAWQRRYFVFEPSGKRLCYSDKPGSKQKGSIPVGDMAVLPVSANTAKLPSHMSPAMAFEVAPPLLQGSKGRTYWLAAETATEKEKWIGAMLPHCKVVSTEMIELGVPDPAQTASADV